jgi:hypothetical protein
MATMEHPFAQLMKGPQFYRMFPVETEVAVVDAVSAATAKLMGTNKWLRCLHKRPTSIYKAAIS